jgi:hypothetical protein
MSQALTISPGHPYTKCILGPSCRMRGVHGIQHLAKQTVQRNNGHTSRCKMTTGWQICCQWLDCLTTWENLSDLKESHPIEMTEYAVMHRIDHKPAFNWWVKHFLKKRNRIISLVKRHNTRYLKWMHKFGIEVPKMVAKALALEKKNGNMLWVDAIMKELKNI